MTTNGLSVIKYDMSLRDYFAGQALPYALLKRWDNDVSIAGIGEDAAIWAYCWADAMLKERDE